MVVETNDAGIYGQLRIIENRPQACIPLAPQSTQVNAFSNKNEQWLAIC